MKCTGKHDQKVEKQQEKAEKLKALEASKSEELERAHKDRKDAAALVARLQAEVQELYRCRDSEMQLVESLFAQGSVDDDREKELKDAFVKIGPQAHQVSLNIHPGPFSREIACIILSPIKL
eukprot:scaffold122527_cov34-Prasinocladus_malaysianus.AAC.1